MRSASPLVLSLTLAAPPLADAQVRPAPPPTVHLDGRVSVPMETDLVKPSVQVTIGGHGPFRFLLDTGSSLPLIINDDLVRELGLPTAPGRRIGDPSNPRAIETVDVQVPYLAIGAARFEGLTAASWERSALYSGPDAPRGIVGFSLFHDVLLTLDYPGKRMILTPGALPPDEKAGVIGFTLDRRIPAVPITVAGKPFTAHLDSGSMGSLTLPIAEAEGLPLAAAPVVIGQGRTVNTAFEISRATLNGTVEFGPHTLTNPDLHFNSVFDEINIGSEVLSQFRLTFDQKNGRLRIESPASGAEMKPKPRRRTYGLMVDPRSVPPKVLRLLPGSVAERSGLRVGDVIVAIDGTPTEEMLVGDIASAFRQPSVSLLVDRDGSRHSIEMSLDSP